jgi:hypothetical protein
MVVAAVAAITSDARPTGWAPTDLLAIACANAAVTWAASRARRWAAVVAGGVAAAFAVGVWAWIALAALLVAIALVVLDRRSRVLGAVAGAGAVVALAHLDLDRPRGLSVLVGLLAVAPVLVSADRVVSRRTRRRIRRGVAWGAAVFGLMVVGFLLAALHARIRLEAAIDDVHDGVHAATRGERTDAIDALDRAVRALDSANGAVTAWWSRPAFAVPLVGLQADALDVLTAEVASVARMALEAAEAADLTALTSEPGVVDVDAVGALRDPLQRLADRLQVAADRVADARSPLLVPVLADRVDDAVDELADSAVSAARAVDVVGAVPDLLGAEAPRRYFVAFVTPSESRGSGGFMGNWAEVTADAGQLSLSAYGRTADLRDAPGARSRTLTGLDEYVARYGRFEPTYYLQDVPFSPDFPTVAQAYEQLYPQAGGPPVDGVLSVDPYALAELLRFTGPIRVEGVRQELTHRNAAEFLLRDQYLEVSDRRERVDVLESAGRAAFERLSSAQLPNPSELTRVLGPLVRQGRLLFHSTRPEEQDVLRELGLDGAFPPPRADRDFVAVVSQNGSNDKIDLFLQRELRYEVAFDPDTGSVHATATVTIRNDAPSSGLPDAVIASPRTGLPPGTNRMYLSVYSPHGLVGATVDGEPLAVESAVELGRNVYSAFVTVPPGSAAVIELELDGHVTPSAVYSLDVAAQPLIAPDAVTVTVEAADGWEPSDVEDDAEVDGRRVTRSFAADEDRTLRQVLRRS